MIEVATGLSDVDAKLTTKDNWTVRNMQTWLYTQSPGYGSFTALWMAFEVSPAH